MRECVHAKGGRPCVGRLERIWTLEGKKAINRKVNIQADLFCLSHRLSHDHLSVPDANGCFT